MSNQSENTSNEIIDVEIDDKRRQYIKELLNKNGFYIPERYYVQLVKLNLLNYLVQMVEEENQMKSSISNILKQHSIYIPEKFYQPLVNKKLFWKLIRAIRLADIKRQLEQLDQLPIDHSDDDDDNDDKDSMSENRKRKRSDVDEEEEEDVDSIVNKIFHSSD